MIDAKIKHIEYHDLDNTVCAAADILVELGGTTAHNKPSDPVEKLNKEYILYICALYIDLHNYITHICRILQIWI